MKQLILTFGIVMGLCYTTQTFAQRYENENTNEEKIILDDKNNEGETVIQIKNGKLFVDGKKVADVDESTTLKIVKKNTVADNYNRDFDIDIKRLDAPFRQKTITMNNRKAMLGVYSEDAEPGAKVKEVVPGSAAEKAGLREGDVITAIDGKTISSSQDLIEAIGKHDKGDEISIGLKRNNSLEELTAQLGAPPSPIEGEEIFGSFPFKSLEGMFDYPKDLKILEAKSMAATPKIGLELEENENGLEVMSVQPNGPCEKAGIQKGDLIKTMEGENVSSLTEIKEQLLNNAKSKKINIGVKRGGAIKTLAVDIPQAKKRAQF